MATKVEMMRDEKRNLVMLAFECSTVEDQEVIDAVRVAIMGDHEKTCGYINSNRLVVHIKEGSI